VGPNRSFEPGQSSNPSTHNKVSRLSLPFWKRAVHGAPAPPPLKNLRVLVCLLIVFISLKGARGDRNIVYGEAREGKH
jgi:hypothetical protein